MTKKRLTCVVSAIAVAILSSASFAQLDTTFTYQGELKQNGIPANGAFNMVFVLFDAEVGGSQASAAETFLDLPVVDGKFTVQLDWGAEVFDNSARWLQMSVNEVSLSPRNPITRAPYAIQTRGIFVDDDNQVGIGTEDPQYPLDVRIGFLGPAIHGESSGTGVSGVGSGSFGTGVFGLAEKTSGINAGFRGQSDSPDGYDFFANGVGVDYGTSSSRRWKSNIEAIEKPLEKISGLRGVYFDWDKEHGGKHDVGMIAEDVGKILPEIVQYEENGIDAHGMDYSKLTPLLVESVKALHRDQQSHTERTTQLEQEHKMLRSQNRDDEIKSLKDRINKLEQFVEQLASNEQEKTK